MTAIRIRRESCGAIYRAFSGNRCLATALMRRTYSQGPLFTITYSDGSHHGTADSTWEMRRELRSAALAMMAELAAPEAVAEPVAAEPDQAKPVCRCS